jgi:hypothetical protein
MDYKEIIEKAKEIKGQFASVEYTKTCKVKKGSPVVTKTTKASSVRVGCEYDGLKSTLENKGVDTKEEAHLLNNGLRGMHYVSYPVVLASDKTNKEYIRFSTCKGTKFTSQYFLEGKPVEKKDIECYLLASEKSKGEMPSVINIGVENITNLNIR